MSKVVCSLIILAGIGLLAVLGMGTYFALKPKFAVRSEDNSVLVHGAENREGTFSLKGGESATLASSAPLNNSTKMSKVTSTHRTTLSSFVAFTTSTSKTFQTTTPSTTEVVVAENLEIVSNNESNTGLLSQSLNYSSSNSSYAEAPLANTSHVDVLEHVSSIQEVHFKHYGKVVGITTAGDRVYVPSATKSKIAVLTLPRLTLLKELHCDGCTIFDIEVLNNGELILSMGKQKRLRKIAADGTTLKEVTLPFASKGIAVNNYNEIFILSWSEGTVYVYDEDLFLIGPVKIQLLTPQECNYLCAGDNDTLMVSCENHIYVIDLQGHLIRLLSPVDGFFSVGIAKDASGNVLAVKRGTATANVFNSDGQLIRTIVDDNSTLWSDILINDKRLFVIDYANSTLQMYDYEV